MRLMISGPRDGDACKFYGASLRRRWCQTMCLRGTIVLLLTVLWLFNGAPAAHAHEADTHYAWTYYLALHAGYTKRQAFQIASAAYAIDEDPNTGPMEATAGDALFGANHAGLTGTKHPEIARVWEQFHAFGTEPAETEKFDIGPGVNFIAPVSTVMLADLGWLNDHVEASGKPMENQSPEKRIELQRSRNAERLWKLAVRDRNPGPLIHFAQDYYSHYEYDSVRGHATAGHKPDFLSNDISKSRGATLATLLVLQRFMKEVMKGELKPVNFNRIWQVFDRMVQANPAPWRLNPANYGADFGLINLGGIGRPSLPRGLTVINSAVAEDEAAGHLPAWPEPSNSDLPPRWWQYNYDSEGRITPAWAKRYAVETAQLEIVKVEAEVKNAADTTVQIAFRLTYKISGLVADLPLLNPLPVIEEHKLSDYDQVRKSFEERAAGEFVTSFEVQRGRADLEKKPLVWTATVHVYGFEPRTFQRTVQLEIIQFHVAATVRAEVPGQPEEHWPAYSGASVLLGNEARLSGALGGVGFEVPREGSYILTAVPRKGDTRHGPGKGIVALVDPRHFSDPAERRLQGKTSDHVVITLPYKKPPQQPAPAESNPGHAGGTLASSTGRGKANDELTNVLSAQDRRVVACQASISAAGAALSQGDTQLAASHLEKARAQKCGDIPEMGTALDVAIRKQADAIKQQRVETLCQLIDAQESQCRFEAALETARVLEAAAPAAPCLAGKIRDLQRRIAERERMLGLLQAAQTAIQAEDARSTLALLRQAQASDRICFADQIQQAISLLERNISWMDLLSSNEPPPGSGPESTQVPRWLASNAGLQGKDDGSRRDPNAVIDQARTTLDKNTHEAIERTRQETLLQAQRDLQQQAANQVRRDAEERANREAILRSQREQPPRPVEDNGHGSQKDQRKPAAQRVSPMEILLNALQTAVNREQASSPPSSPDRSRPPQSSSAPVHEKLLQDIVVNSQRVTITVSDAECEDGDRITVSINGVPFLENFRLTNQRQSFSLTLPYQSNTIEVFANNGGESSPPGMNCDLTVNSGAISISNAVNGGQQSWQLRQQAGSKARIIVQ